MPPDLQSAFQPKPLLPLAYALELTSQVPYTLDTPVKASARPLPARLEEPILQKKTLRQCTIPQQSTNLRWETTPSPEDTLMQSPLAGLLTPLHEVPILPHSSLPPLPPRIFDHAAPQSHSPISSTGQRLAAIAGTPPGAIKKIHKSQDPSTGLGALKRTLQD